MKKLFLAILLVFPVVAWAETNCQEGLDECKYTSKITFEIIDSSDGSVADRTQYERLIGVSYAEAMALKYMGMKGIIEGGVETFVKVLKSEGDALQALSEDQAQE